MPSRQLPHHSHHHTPSLLPPLAASGGLLTTLLLCLLYLCRKLRKNPTSPTPSIRRFSYSSLRRATSSFSSSTRLGQGGFGSVHLATLSNKKLAVKVMEAGSLQGEREFQNEITIFEKIHSNSNGFVVSLLGFASKRHRMLLVYEYMCNGSLQDALLYRKDVRLKVWENRFTIALDVAKGIEYLHSCDPPIVHCDIKPSNVLLDGEFKAKIGDFGLARFKEGKLEVERKEDNGGVDDDVDTESVTTVTTMGLDDFSVCVDRSPESFVRVMGGEKLPERGEQAAVVVSHEERVGEGSLNGNFDGLCVEGEKEIKEISCGDVKESGSRKMGNCLKDGSQQPNKVVKDYVIEWIGTEVRKERPKNDWIGDSSSGVTTKEKKENRKRNKKRLEWWMSLDDEKCSDKERKGKRRPAREWWKEEYSKELAKKQKKKRQMGLADDAGVNNYWPRDEELYVNRKGISRSGSRNSRGSIDWWLDGLSGELWKGRPKSYDSANGEIPRSGGIVSTPSMRGTVCYVAPEYGGTELGDFSEKCDVYSYGVLLLVLIAGRRPLQVTGSPISEFKRANLISWARNLARSGKLLDLVDKSIGSVNKEQALLCIRVALLCLQKSPSCRPSMKEVVAMLSGVLDLPQLPYELFPSPNSYFPFMSQKNVR